MTQDVQLNGGANDNSNAWEGGGVTWGTTQNNITSVEYTNGSWMSGNDGAFVSNFKLQFSTDGTTWTDSGWTSSPSYDYDSPNASGKTYVFSGSKNGIKGARVVGQVHVGTYYSWFVNAREVKVFTP